LQYDAFGVEIDPDEDDTNPFRYAGQYYDTETGTYYLRARYYDPATGRFTQQDSWDYSDPKDPLSLNLYVYCYGNPVRYVDLTGNFAIEGAIALGIGVFALLALAATTAIAIQELPAPEYSYRSSQGEFYTNKRILRDLDVVIEEIQEDLEFIYYLAYIDADGNLIPFSVPMNYDTAFSMLGITAGINFTEDTRKLIKNLLKSSEAKQEVDFDEKHSKWGIYTYTQEAAKKLAVSVGCVKPPEVEDVGYFGHYHDFTHTIHIWYGYPLYY